MDYMIFDKAYQANKELDEMFNKTFPDPEMVKRIN